MIAAEDILKFWFEEITPKDWWKKSEEFDQMIEQRFGDALNLAKSGEVGKEGGLNTWREKDGKPWAEGRLAEIIVLDQFSRNVYRGKPESFAQDLLALSLAREAVDLGVDQALSSVMKSFLYMPFMHSEDGELHEQAMELFASDPELSFNLDFEKKHKVIIDRFGRYPHRNEILGRKSTEEELEFLKGPGSSF